jgi:2Fe-2S ferredoxin
MTAKVIYIEHNGTKRIVDVPIGQTVMEGARGHAVPGIDAECGGACACATCHVYVDEQWIDMIGAASSNEIGMLEFAAGVRPNSRLSCQITVTDRLDGLIVQTPESQH